MRKNILQSLTVALLASLLIFSCQREKSYINSDGNNPTNNSSAKVITSVGGRVVDENNVPIQGAQVRAGSATALTDINGSFLFADIELEKNTGYIQINKSGYFPGSRTIITKEKTLNYVSIELIPKKESGTVNAAIGGIVNVASGGGSISFQSNSFINASNNASYTGTVIVSAFTFDPIAANFSEIMPGALRGITTANEERGLQSFGMMAVELTGAGGEKLQLASGKTATITFPIPSSLQASAPATMPLWFFDETKGIWKEEGIATRQGSNYIGTVNHFSFWNVDAPFPLVNFEAQLKDQNNNPLRGQKVLIRYTGNPNFASGYTDSSGFARGLIPANQALQLVIYNSCNTIIHTQNIGPFSTAVKLDALTVNTGSMMNIPVSGTVKDCNNATLSSGNVTLFVAGRVFRANIVNGNFATTVFSCSPNTIIKAIAYNALANQYGDTLTVQTTGNTATTINLTACGNIASQFINYTLNGIAYAVIVPGDSIIFDNSNSSIHIDAYMQNFSKSFGFSWNSSDTLPGNYTLNSLNVYHGANQHYTKSGTINLTLTQHGKINESIIGSFTGSVRDSSNGTNYPINCNFKIKRTR